MRFDESTATQLLKLKNDPMSGCILNHGRQTIYGTGSAQKVYLRLQEYFATPAKKSHDARSLSEHVNKKHIVKEDYDEISNYWLSVKGQYITQGADGVPDNSGNKKTFWKDFDAAYAKSGKNPKALPAAIKGPEIKPPQAVAFTPRDQDALIDDIIVRRSCKFLLYDSIARKQSVAYVLDDLNLTTVATRITVEEAGSSGSVERKVPVCTSELREIFRRWDYFAEHLTFYKDFVVCDPPWFKEGQDSWARYALHLTGKLPARDLGHAKKLAEIQDLFDKSYFGSVICRYHDLKPSRVLPGAFVNLVAAH